MSVMSTAKKSSKKFHNATVDTVLGLQVLEHPSLTTITHAAQNNRANGLTADVLVAEQQLALSSDDLLSHGKALFGLRT